MLFLPLINKRGFMKTFILGLLVLSSFSAFAFDENIAKVKKLVAPLITGSDINISVIKDPNGFCGSGEAAYIAKVAFRKYEKTLGADGLIEIKPTWKVFRTYGVSVSEIKNGTKALMATEACID
jgi:hypothetical protein